MTKPIETAPAVDGQPEWFIAKDGRKLGPFNHERMAELAASGALRPHDMVLSFGGGTWAPAEKVDGIRFGPSQPASGQPIPNKTAPTAVRPEASTSREWATLRHLAVWHYRMNGIVLIQLVVYSFVWAIAYGVDRPNIGQGLVLASIPVFSIIMLATVFQLAKRLGHSPWPVTGIAFVLFPAVWLYLDVRVRRILGQAGIRKGMLGAILPAAPPANFVGGRIQHLAVPVLKTWSRRCLFGAIAALPISLVVWANAEVNLGEKRELLLWIAQGVLVFSGVCAVSWLVLCGVRIVHHFRH